MQSSGVINATHEGTCLLSWLPTSGSQALLGKCTRVLSTVLEQEKLCSQSWSQ